MKRVAASLAALTLAAALSSCAQATTGTSARADVAVRTASASTLAVAASSRVTAPVGDVLAMAVSPHDAYLAGSRQAAPNDDRVFHVDLASGRTTTLATSSYPDGMISGIARVGDWVAWVDQSHVQSDGADQGARDGMDVTWRLLARNATTGRTVVLDHHDTAGPDVPRVSGQAGTFAWAVPDGTGTTGGERVLTWTPGDRAPRTVLRHVESVGGPFSISDGQLVYLGPAAGRVDDPVAGDCWTVPLTGNRAAPRALTHSGLAEDCQAGHGALVWSEHISPGYRPVPPDGVLDDPWEIKARSLGSDTTAHLLSRGYTSGRFPSVGAGFAVWDGAAGRHSVVVRGTRSTTNVLALPQRSAQLYAASGRTVVTLSHEASRRSELVLHRFVIGS